MEIGEKIRQLRIHKKMTQGQLVDGISSITYLSRIENGNIKPSQAFIQSIAPRLGVQIEDLWGNNEESINRRIITIAKEFRKKQILTEEELSFLSLQANEIHSLEIYLNIYTTLIDYYLKSNEDIDGAWRTYQLATKFIPRELNESLLKEFYYYYVVCGNLFYFRQDFFMANQFYSSAEQFVELFNDPVEEARLSYNLSLVKDEIIEDKTVCIFYAQKAYNLYSEQQYEQGIINSLIILGIQHHLHQNDEKALTYLHQAMELISSKDKLSQAYVEYNLGQVYAGKEDEEKAIQHYLTSLELYDQIPSNHRKIYPYLRLIELFTRKKDWNLVEDYLQQALSLVDPEKASLMHLKFLSIKANTYRLRDNELRYEKDMHKIIQLSIQKNQLKLVATFASELANHYYEKRAYKKAADYFVTAENYTKKMNLS
ncbi:DNA-binding transcriptional regulator, XRE-family HTH domain [Marininema mesophilum]|uniref:DNA-binding transcriptional regulator, XRE-family HTH domain n=1 Tax=Marininema mesophilum TaxID=1048340 RepID=A0A1H2WLW8_9BACL|nr:tetratricopeptide repeat protein [Marininema mesophilum]SDW81254.1 DNA-binding transcriptional regulator, XRE-family HTH domain [Marininema mesophilum]